MEMDALKELAIKYYPLAFTLLPEDLMATQLIIDGFSGLLLSEEGLLIEDEEVLETEFVKRMVELARIRHQHFSHKSTSSFYSLPLDERAVVFMRDRMDLKPTKIATYLNCHHERVLALLHQARTEVVESLGMTMEDAL